MKEKKNKIKNNKNRETLNWVITIVIITFLVSLSFSYIFTVSMNGLSFIPAVLILVLIILIGVIFDVMAVSVTVAEEHEFHAKASKKIRGAKTSLSMIRNSAKVANVCADVIGDICGVISGSMSAILTLKITQQFGLTFDLQFILSALVASLTVGGKAIGKGIAQKNSTKIVHEVGKFVSFVKFER